MAKTSAFEDHSDAYDQWFERNAAAYAAELKAVETFLADTSLKGIEIGVGSGKFAEPLGIRIGLEPCAQMAEKARRLGIDVVTGVAEALPFGDDEFDFALMVTTICFVDDLAQSFREVRRILKSGGFIVVGFVDKLSELGKQYQANRHNSRFYQQATFFSTQDVLGLLRDAGFGVPEIVQTLLPDDEAEKVIDGYGQGAFVVIKAPKES
ncbi:MAG: methyltransferase domain-containing protein [Desulfuromonadales bacterium]|nr:methyltransferase domain-containing protein [Desulfuromonadales bacterium]MBN2792655.1 methyltransferase domain-containing protein [Desulfuromonadales bacterium]